MFFLSIIIPTKNEEKYIGRCLDSLANSISSWNGLTEIMVIDAGSADQTRAIAESKGSMVIQKEPCFVSSSRNAGFNISKGEIVAFLDADCLVDPKWIECCLKNFSDPTIAAVGTRAIPDLENATWVEIMWYRLMSGAKRPEFVEWLGTSNLFVRRSVFEDIGGFDENLETGEDMNLCNKIRKKHRIFLEQRINTVHLRESKTLVELFKREYWRGNSSIRSLLKGYLRKEWRSVVFPAINSVAIFMSLFFSISGNGLIIVPLFIVFIFPVFLMARKKVKLCSLGEVIKCYIVAFMYIFSRSCSLVEELRKLSFSIEAKK